MCYCKLKAACFSGRLWRECGGEGGGGARRKEGKMAMWGGLSGEVLLFRDCARTDTPVPCVGMCATACGSVASEKLAHKWHLREFAILPRKAINSQINTSTPPPASILDVQAIEKTKEIALRGEESASALSAQRLLCMSASSDTNYASAERMCLNVRPPLQPTPPSSHPPPQSYTQHCTATPTPSLFPLNPLPDSRSYP